MTYVEQAAQLAIDSSVSAQVLMGSAPGDIEFMQLRPKMADETVWAELIARRQGSELRSVGAVGLVGVTPRCVLKEQLSAQEVSAIASAFLAYVHAIHWSVLSSQIETADVEPEYLWDERRYRLVPRHA